MDGSGDLYLHSIHKESFDDDGGGQGRWRIRVGGNVVGGGGDDHLVAAKIHRVGHEILFGSFKGKGDFTCVLFFSTFGNSNKFKIGSRDVTKLC